MRSTVFTILFLASYGIAWAQSDPDIALTPPMGWNSWNLFEDEVSEDIIKQIADAMVENGMKEAGYVYIIIDDMWQGGRNSKNRLIPDSKRFPGGMKALSQYVHSKGLKLGIYSDAARWTCAGHTGSYGFEDIDAQTFAEWGIDYLKYDYCNAPGDMIIAMKRYKKMGDALHKTGRPIVFAICEWGVRKPWLWAREAGGNLWRTTWDSRDVWETEKYDSGHAGIINILDRQEGLECYAGPGGWNDPDMLMTGLYGKAKSASHGGAYGCSDIEYKSQFSLWCMLAAPLIVNLDVRNINKATKEILLNKEVIAINQDSLGKQGFKFIDQGDFEIYVKELSDNGVAVCLFNRCDKEISTTVETDKILARFGIFKQSYNIRDLWKHRDIGKTGTPLTVRIEGHGVVMLRLSK